MIGSVGWTPTRLTIAGVGGVTLLAVGILLGTLTDHAFEKPAPPHHEGRHLAVTVALDSFDRPAGSLVLPPGRGPAWRVEAGSWEVADGQAAATDPRSDRSIAVVRLPGGQGAVQLTLSHVTNGAGVVFRYRDRRNYWSVSAAPLYATWVITKTVGGRTTLMGNTGISPMEDGTVIAVRVQGDVIDIAFDGQIGKTLSDGDLRGAPEVGMGVPGPVATTARFDDFRVALPGDKPLPGVEPVPPTAPTTTSTTSTTSTVPATAAPVTETPVRRPPSRPRRP